MQNIVQSPGKLSSNYTNLLSIRELERITLSPNFIIQTREYEKNIKLIIPQFLIFDDQILEFEKLIDHGSYGSVYSYKNNDKNINIALKSFIDPKNQDHEIQIVRNISNINICLKYNIMRPVVKNHTYSCDEYSYVIMNQAIGSLLEFKKSGNHIDELM